MRGFTYQARQLGDFVIGGDAVRTVQNANPPLRKIALQFLDHRDNGAVIRIDAEYDLVIRIILHTEARQVFVSFGIEATDWLQIADWRRKIRIGNTWRLAEISPGAENRDQVIDERDGRDSQENVGGNHVVRLPAGRGWLLSNTLPPLAAIT